MKREEGFVLPMTFILTTIVIFFFLSQVNALMLERKYYHEVAGVMELDYMTELAVFAVKKDIGNGLRGTREFTIHFQEGLSEIRVVEEETFFQITILSQVTSGQSAKVTFTYDATEDRIFDWKEG